MLQPIETTLTTIGFTGRLFFMDMFVVHCYLLPRVVDVCLLAPVMAVAMQLCTVAPLTTSCTELLVLLCVFMLALMLP